MGYRNRITDEAGSVSLEAACAIIVLLIVAVMVIQSLAVGLWHVRARGVVAEAVRIATASGEPATQVALARSFIGEQLPQATVNQQVSGAGVRFEVTESLRIPAISWQPEVHVSESGMWQDAWAQ